MHVERLELFPAQLSAAIFFLLERRVRYLENQKICSLGGHYDLPRKHVAHGDCGLKYDQNGIKLSAEPWLDILLALRNKVSYVTGHRFNFVTINRYDTGLETHSFHGVRYRNAQDPTVAVLSFGAERPITFRNRNSFTPHDFDLKLGHGWLTILHSTTEEHFRYGLLRKTHVQEPHINLTFRCLKM